MHIENKFIILKTFNDLLKEHDMSKISVLMICEHAHVSKATFYRHFHDKYDVMNYNYKIYLDYYISISHTYEELYCHLYKMAKDHNYLKQGFKVKGYNSFSDYIYQYSYQVIIDVTKRNRNGSGLTREEELQVDVFLNGIKVMYEKWFLHDYSLTPSTAAKALFAIMPETLKYYDIQKMDS